jgi:hypothetical protein
LILDTAGAIGIGFEKTQDFFLIDAGLFETVQELTEAHLAAQLAHPGQKFFTVRAHAPE